MTPRRRLLGIASSCILLACTSNHAAPGVQEAGSAETLDALVERLRDEHGVPALAALVFDGDEVLEQAVAGVRKSGDDIHVKLADKWHLGSNTKAMTATIAATFVEEGKFARDWDTTLAEAMPELASTMHADSRKVTLGQLLTMRSGFHDEDPAYETLPEVPDFATMSVEEQRRSLASQRLSLAPRTAPGTFHYANFSYILVGAVLEAVSGTSWEALMQERIFGPLGMTDCGFGPPASPGTVDQPWGHLRVQDELVPVAPESPGADNPAVLGPAGTVHCSLASWLPFARAHLVGEAKDDGLIAASTFAQLHAPASDSQYAMGWIVNEGPWGPMLAHDGSNTMNYARVVLAREQGVGILIVTNEASPEHAVPAVNELTDALMQRHLR